MSRPLAAERAAEGVGATVTDDPLVSDEALVSEGPLVSDGAKVSDEVLVSLALDEAIRALPDDVPVGAVVVDGTGSVLGRGYNSRKADADPTAHAEILALREAARRAGSWNLAGATIGVTVEPCTMCAGAIVAARVQRLVFGCWEPKTGAVGSLWDVVRDRRLTHRVEVSGGVLADRCAALLEEFFAARR